MEKADLDSLRPEIDKKINKQRDSRISYQVKLSRKCHMFKLSAFRQN